MKIVGIVYIYLPDFEELKKNIEQYIHFIDKLVIWQNSSLNKNQKNLLKQKYCDKIEFLGTGENFGIAVPTNNVIEKYKTEFDYLITMDQDSLWMNFNYYINEVNSYFSLEDSKVSIFGPKIITDKNKYMEGYKNIIDVDHVITSGAIYPMILFQKIGLFNESYFIDALDENICYRAKEKKIKTYCVNNAFLFQKYGETTQEKFLFWNIKYMRHSPMRTYYIVRNHIYLIKDCKIGLSNIIRLLYRYIFIQFFKILFYDKDRINKIRCLISGFLHGLFKKRQLNEKRKMKDKK